MAEKRDFDKAALTWDEKPQRVKIATDIAAAIKESIPLSLDWDAMDIGCGTGLVTLALAPHLRSITGVDGSAGMLEKLIEKAAAMGMDNVKTLLCDLDGGEIPEGTFHLICSAMTLHHLKTPATLAPSLLPHLHPGGWLALADLASEDGSFHEDNTGVFHYGFSEQELTEMLQKAGFCNISVITAAAISKAERDYPVLLAVAQRGL